MGAFFGGKCFDSQAGALDAYYGGAPVSHSGGAIGYTSFFEKSGSVWQWVTKENNGGVITSNSVAAPVLTFPTCDPQESLTDGIAVGWLLVLSLLVGWTFAMIRGQVR